MKGKTYLIRGKRYEVVDVVGLVKGSGPVCQQCELSNGFDPCEQQADLLLDDCNNNAKGVYPLLERRTSLKEIIKEANSEDV